VTERPLISVVIPTRNRRRQLCLALRSAMQQHDVDLEIIVVDDASEDDTAEMVAHLGDARVRLARNDVARGESGARNRGLDEARGEWVAFLDDDDIWAPTKLSRQLAAAMAAGCEWAYAGHVTVDRDLRILSGAPPPSPEQVLERLRHYNAVPGSASTVIARTRSVLRVGPFDPTLKRTADWDMWLRLAHGGPPAWVRAPLVAICVHPGNMSRDMTILFRELDEVAGRHRIPVDKARHYRWAAWEALAAGNRREALGYYARAVKTGDVRSLGRALVALLNPAYARRARRPMNCQADAWTSEARAWIDAHELNASK
jgi:glycosyltransferase involved in cell wall biosynthesis